MWEKYKGFVVCFGEHLAGEPEVPHQNNNWFIKEISVRVSFSSDDQSDLHAGPQTLQTLPFPSPAQ